MNKSVKDGSAAFFSVNFKDPTGADATPTSVTVTLINWPSNAVVRAETPLPGPMAPTMTFKTLDTENVIRNRRNENERMRVILKSNYGVGDSLVDSFDYEIERVSNQ